MKEDIPEGFPPLTLQIMRALCAITILDSSSTSLCKALDTIFQAFWVEHKVAHKPEVLKALLTKAVGPDMTEKGMNRIHSIMK
jgi:2-hydroxychromene-2-carboxylate isomerase